MGGNDAAAGSLFRYVDLQKRIRSDHPLRVIRAIVNTTLRAMSAELDALYSSFGRESIPPERLLRALLLQAFYTIRSERQLLERIECDLLFRRFVGLGVDDPVRDATSFTKNRDRLLAGELASRFLAAVLAQPQVKVLLSGEHFSVDGTRRRRGRAPGVFGPKTAAARRPIRPATVSKTSTARSAATTRMPRPPIRMPGSLRKGQAGRPNSASWAMP